MTLAAAQDFRAGDVVNVLELRLINRNALRKPQKKC